MKLTVQKRIAAQTLGCSEKRIVFDPERLMDIKEAITKADIRSLVKDKLIHKKPKRGVSRVRARRTHVQKRKGRQKGKGNRRGTAKARSPKKRVWINKIRLLRNFLKELKDKGYFTTTIYRMLYLKSKGGFFRNKKHIKIYIDDHQLANKLEKGKK